MPIQPLAQSRADQRRFVDRTREADAIIRAIAAAQPVLVLGDRGSGRTSLLNHVAWRLARQKEPRGVVMVSGELASSPSQLLGVLVARVQRLAEPGASRARWIEDLRALSLPDGPFGQVAQPAIVMELVDLLGERLAALNRPVCLMVDGIAPAVAHGVFGSLRNELWTLDGASLGRRGRQHRRGALSGAARRRVLRAHHPAWTADRCRRGEAAARPRTLARGPEIERAIAVADGNPRRLLRAAADIQAGADPASSAAEESAAQAVAVAGKLAGALVRYVAAHGPTAASDEAMLRQIGASRQRASQLMHELESAGVLETIEHHEPGRRGRPARRFALRAQA